MDDAIDLEALVVDALERLPEPFRERLGSVAIVIEDEPSPDPARLGRGARPVRAVPGRAADERSARTRRPCPARSRSSAGRSCGPTATPERLAAGVTDTVYHEIAHHFGISDARLRELREAQ